MTVHWYKLDTPIWLIGKTVNDIHFGVPEIDAQNWEDDADCLTIETDDCTFVIHHQTQCCENVYPLMSQSGPIEVLKGQTLLDVKHYYSGLVAVNDGAHTGHMAWVFRTLTDQIPVYWTGFTDEGHELDVLCYCNKNFAQPQPQPIVSTAQSELQAANSWLTPQEINYYVNQIGGTSSTQFVDVSYNTPIINPPTQD